jgi:predicted amidohydrolase
MKSSENLKICLVQSIQHWENIDANLHHFTSIIHDISSPTDVIVLPEMFSTGFSMNTNLAEDEKGKAMLWLNEMAKQKQTVICGSIMTKDGNNFVNRFLWMYPDGNYEYYDKRHCFRMAGEHEHYRGGKEKKVIEYKGFKICLMVCYDLRFPVWSRNRYLDNQFEYDILLYTANWPERRNLAWKSLLPARAIENLSYVVAVNRVGKDGKDVAYSGDSAVYNMLGEKISSLHPHVENHEIVSISKEELDLYRSNFPAYLDADDFEIST